MLVPIIFDMLVPITFDMVACCTISLGLDFVDVSADCL